MHPSDDGFSCGVTYLISIPELRLFLTWGYLPSERCQTCERRIPRTQASSFWSTFLQAWFSRYSCDCHVNRGGLGCEQGQISPPLVDRFTMATPVATIVRTSAVRPYEITNIPCKYLHCQVKRRFTCTLKSQCLHFVVIVALEANMLSGHRSKCNAAVCLLGDKCGVEGVAQFYTRKHKFAK